MRSWAKICLLAALALGCGKRALAPHDAPDATASSAEPDAIQPTDASSSLPVDAARASPSMDGASSVVTSPADAALQRDLGAVGSPRPYRAISIALGAGHACALLEDHRIKCWGDNDSGQLGYGDNVDRGKSRADMGDALPAVDLGTGRTAVQLVAGEYTTCALLDDGHVKCWGAAGLNGTMQQLGDEPGEMGDHLAPLPVPPGRTVKLIGAGRYSPMAILDDGSGWLWVNGTTLAVPLPTKAVARKIVGVGFGQLLVLFADGTVEKVTLDPANNGVDTTPLLLLSGSPVVGAADISGSIETGWCAAMVDGHVACSISYVPGSTASDIVGVAAGLGSCVLMSSGTVGCSGAGGSWSMSATDGPTTDGYFTVNLGEPATIVAAADTYACARLASGGIKCWGPPNNCLGLGAAPPCDDGTYIVAGTVAPNGDGTFTWDDTDLGTFEPSPSE
jgi:hypothetical protein